MVGHSTLWGAAVALLMMGTSASPATVAAAQNPSSELQASCLSFGQSLNTNLYGTIPWQPSVVDQHASPEYRQAMQGTSLATVMAPDQNELGALQQQSDATAMIDTAGSGSAAATTCTYQANGSFEHGTATVGLLLVYRAQEWQVVRVRMHDVEQGAAS